jgi:uncharacterized protein (TIGR03083 family)
LCFPLHRSGFRSAFFVPFAGGRNGLQPSCGARKSWFRCGLMADNREFAMKPVAPILVAELFPELRRCLLGLLDDLAPEDWLAPTAAGKWNVKDVTLHLLGGDLGNLSRRRDKHSLPASIHSWDDLVAFINRINQSWVDASQRLSTRVLRDLLEHSGRQMDEYFQGLDPFGLGAPVSWAGPRPAPNWLDIAREYTERWHHQQQIRDATGRPGLYEPRLFAPVLDAFVRALPHTFGDVDASPGTAVQLTIPGDAGGSWTLVRAETVRPSDDRGADHPAGKWELLSGTVPSPGARVVIAPEIAWKIFTRGIRNPQPQVHAKVTGDPVLGARVLGMVSVIA